MSNKIKLQQQVKIKELTTLLALECAKSQIKSLYLVLLSFLLNEQHSH